LISPRRLTESLHHLLKQNQKVYLSQSLLLKAQSLLLKTQSLLLKAQSLLNKNLNAGKSRQ
jgi:hypothetical protein